MLWNKIDEQFGLEWDRMDTTEHENEDNIKGIKLDIKRMMSICLVNAKMVKQDGLPVAIPGHEYLFIGSLGSAYNLPGLKDHNITHILCLSDVVKSKFPAEFVYKRVPMKDVCDFNLLDCIDECFAFIEEGRKSRGDQGKVLVHCYQGKSRSVAIILAYLMRFHRMNIDEALSLVRDARPMACPNSGFMNMLRSLSQGTATLDIDNISPSQTSVEKGRFSGSNSGQTESSQFVVQEALVCNSKLEMGAL